jgi:hypothetical protein
MKREYTKEEAFYRRLFFVSLHYNGKEIDAMDRCSKLLNEVMTSDLQEDFKLHFKSMWKDQVSKLYDIHFYYYKRLKMKFDLALEEKKLA